MKKTEGKKLSQAPKAVQVVAHINGGKHVPAHTRTKKLTPEELRDKSFDLITSAYNSLPGLPQPVDTTPSPINTLATKVEPQAHYEAEMDKATTSTEKLDYLLGDIEVYVKRFNHSFNVKISGRVYADIKNKEWNKYLTPQSIQEHPEYIFVMFNYSSTAEDFGKLIKACHQLNTPVNRQLWDFGYEVGGELINAIKTGSVGYEDLIKTNLYTINLLKKAGSQVDQFQVEAYANLLAGKDIAKDFNEQATEENRLKVVQWIIKSFKHLNGDKK